MAYEVQLASGGGGAVGTGAADPSITSLDYQAQISYWNMIEAILGGEPTIKAGSTTYLPKFEKERAEVYKYRLDTSPFTGVYSDISKSLAAKPFSKEMGLKENTPGQYAKLAENIDGQGNNLHVFASHSFAAALNKGVDWILVDYPKGRAPVGGRDFNRAEVATLGLKPYWVHVSAEQMRAVYSEFVDGIEVIHHARIKEDSKQLDGFVEKTVERIREFKREKTETGYGPPTWVLWEKKDIAGGKSAWFKIDGGAMSIGIIPLVPVVLTKRGSGCWIVEPALRDLAYAQITEYRQEANLNWVTVKTCFPMLCVAGMEKKPDGIEPEVTVGPNQVFLIPQNNAGTGPAGTVTVIEPSTTSIQELRAQLELVRKEMRDLGMQPLAQANLTVTLSSHISKKASSAVQAWAFLFKDAMELAWKYTAMWLGDKSFEPEVIIHTDFAIELETGKEIEWILKAVEMNIISKKTGRAEAKRRNIISNDLSDEDEEQRLAEQDQSLEPEQPIDPRQGRLITRQPPSIAA